MKAKIRKTGEIVDVITYNQCSTIRSSRDFVSYIDSKGVEHDRESLNYYWDFESIEADVINNEHWNDVRERVAIAALQGILSLGEDAFSYEGARDEIAKAAVDVADSLIKELKKKKDEDKNSK